LLLEKEIRSDHLVFKASISWRQRVGLSRGELLYWACSQSLGACFYTTRIITAIATYIRTCKSYFSVETHIYSHIIGVVLSIDLNSDLLECWAGFVKGKCQSE